METWSSILHIIMPCRAVSTQGPKAKPIQLDSWVLWEKKIPVEGVAL